MAITYTWQDALNVAKPSYRTSTDQSALTFALNMAVSECWLGWDWRDSIANLPPFWLVPGVQDYGSPFVSVPTNFYGLREVYLVCLNVTPVPSSTPIKVVSNLEQTGAYGLPNTICYRSAAQAFRIHPAAGLSCACPQYLINGTYKIQPPKIARDGVASLILWDDIYFETFVQFLVWANLFCSGDRKAAIEQKAIAKQTLFEAAQHADLEDGDPVVSPTEGLTLFNSGGPYYGGGFLGY